MKKITWILLALLLVLSFAACRKQPTAPAPTDMPTQAPIDAPTQAPTDAPQDGAESPEGDSGTLVAILEQVYAKSPSLELMMAPTSDVDLADANAVKTYLGLDSAEGITEAVVSEPMMSSVAYSVCLVRTAETADRAALMRAMVDGVDPRKWICVEAESVSAASADNVILLVMTEQTLSNELFSAFSEVMSASQISAMVVRGK